MNKEQKIRLGIEENRPVEWFEIVYAESNKNGDGVPWANMDTHPVFKNWIAKNKIDGKGKSALVVGCGMGDDALALEELGFETTAFDVSTSAIELCEKRFPNSKINFEQANLLENISKWSQKFDFVLEIFTIQALPPRYEKTAIENISQFVSLHGKLMVITKVQTRKRSFKNGPPWLLNKTYIEYFEACGLTQIAHSKLGESISGESMHLTIFERQT